MATKTNASTLFNPQFTGDLFSKVRGFSALAALSNQEPIPFSGKDVMVFSMDGEAAIVGEGANKPAGEAAFSKVSINPLKFVYQHRLSEEFVNLSDEQKVPYMNAFLDGFAKKMARALDICALHGKNPADKAASSAIGTNCFDSVIPAANTIAGGTNVADDLLSAMDKVHESGMDVTGIALSPALGSKLGKTKETSTSNVYVFPEFNGPNGTMLSFMGTPTVKNPTVSFAAAATAGSVNPEAYVGDFENAFKWGYASDIPMEVIEYGDPDGQGDLKRANQIVLRAEAYIGWGILNPGSFAKVTSKVAES